YSICTKLKQVETALSVLSQHPYVVLDCEGKTIGRVDGALSLICLGTPVPGPDQHIYLFDIPTIRHSTAATQAVVSFLSRTDIIKVVWDGKMDAIEIYHTLGMELKRVLDLQVVEVIARQTVLEEGEEERIQRLGPHFGQPVELHPDIFEGIHAVLGMQTCLETYLPHLNVQKDNAVSQIHRRGHSHLWMRRPVPFVLAHYAAADIRFIAYILERF
ncbi:ribonuclease H-like domain-containing protein, partial [Amylostereum chailletii]